MEGYISIHRKITEWEFWFSERFTRSQAWIDLLILANHKSCTVNIRGFDVRIKRGQLCRSKVSLGGRWRWNVRTVSAFISTLRNRQMIHSNSTNVTTVITILNYNEYQISADHKPKKVPSGVQSKVQSRVQSRVPTDNNVNNVNNVKKKYSRVIDEIDIPSLKDQYPNIDVELQFERFKNYLGANGKTYKNYVMAFNNWLTSGWTEKKEVNAIMEAGREYRKRKQRRKQ